MCYKSLSPWTRKIQGVPPTIPPPDEAIIATVPYGKSKGMCGQYAMWLMLVMWPILYDMNNEVIRKKESFKGESSR